MGRLQPAGPAAAYQTYEIAVPLATHWRPATCAEVNCPNYEHGWRVRVEGLDPQLLHTARNAGRRYQELAVGPGETWLVFEAGQACFQASAHRTPLGREPLFLLRGGDFRGNPRQVPTRRHSRAEDWRDDFGEHQNRIADRVERG
jgi:hypothetical protein